MPDSFDSLLTGAVDTATQAARAPGATAARARGRQRRSRRRITAAALAVVLLSGAGAAAAVSVNGGHHGVPSAVTTPTASSFASPTTSPSAGPTPDTSASTTANAGATSGSPSAPSSASTTPSGAQSPVTVPSPGTFVAGGWLSTNQLPFGTGYQGGWRLLTDSSGTLLPESVYEQSSSLLYCGEDMTGQSLSTMSHDLSGAQYREFDGQNLWVTSQVIGAYASQQTLFYPSSAAAQSAWATLNSDYEACPQQMTGYDPTSGIQLTGSAQQTVNESDAQCWSTLDVSTAQMKDPPGDFMHVCLVRSGSLISAATVLLHQSPSLSPVDFGPLDTAAIAALRQALSAYDTGQ